MVNRKRMEQQLLLHEGLRETAYLDTEGNWTIGIGYNVTGRGLALIEKIIGHEVIRDANGLATITSAEAYKVLANDINWFEQMVPIHFPFYMELDEVRQRVVLDMAFNMGFKALGFKNAIAAVKRRDWSTASRELYKSRWAGQVGDGEGGKLDRCDRLSRMLLTGKDYTA